MKPAMGPRYILKDAYQVKQQELSFKKHRQKLDDIKKWDTRKQSEKFDTELERLQQTKIHNLRFQNNEKLNEIDRENQILLERLVHISKTPNPELGNVKSESKLGSALHKTYRQKEQDRINNENAVFAQRLLSQRPLFDRKKLDKDFEKHFKLMKQMQRLHSYSPRFIGKLPPIERDDKDSSVHNSVELKSQREKPSGFSKKHSESAKNLSSVTKNSPKAKKEKITVEVNEEIKESAEGLESTQQDPTHAEPTIDDENIESAEGKDENKADTNRVESNPELIKAVSKTESIKAESKPELIKAVSKTESVKAESKPELQKSGSKQSITKIGSVGKIGSSGKIGSKQDAAEQNNSKNAIAQEDSSPKIQDEVVENQEKVDEEVEDGGIDEEIAE